MATFAGKEWNDKVYAKYLSTVPRIKENQFISNGIFTIRNDIKTLFNEQVGGNYALIPIIGRLSGTPQNYDGSTNITPDNGVGTYTQGVVAIGRMNAWGEKDFVQELTGKNFFEEIGKQTTEYWEDVLQSQILSVLKGIFSTTDTNAADFKNKHVLDITGEAEAEDQVVGPTTLNTAMQKAVGSNKKIFTMAFMHSQVATNLENLKILTYAKQTDAQGMERDVAIATWNGRLVIIDDECPHDSSAGTYETYVLGQGAFQYVDLGVVVPNELARDPYSGGGKNILINRNRKIIAPTGFTFSATTAAASVSPTDAQLEAGSNWTLVSGVDGDGSTAIYFPHKAIPIAKIISKG